MKKEWRPNDWGNLYTGDEKIACERGASAMLTSRDIEWVEWAESKCTDDLHDKCRLRKHFCPICYMERKKKIGL
jgi:hypothetical protein